MYPSPDNSKLHIKRVVPPTYMLSNNRILHITMRARSFHRLQQETPVLSLELTIPLPPLETQQAIVTEIEAERSLVDANRELITRFEKKIQDTISRVWAE